MPTIIDPYFRNSVFRYITSADTTDYNDNTSDIVTTCDSGTGPSLTSFQFYKPIYVTDATNTTSNNYRIQYYNWIPRFEYAPLVPSPAPPPPFVPQRRLFNGDFRSRLEEPIVIANPDPILPEHPELAPENPDAQPRLPSIAVTKQQRADQLLRDVLLHHEYDLYRKRGFVDVLSAKEKGLVYRIRPHNMIVLLDEKGKLDGRQLCIHPVERLCAEDEVVAQYVMARFDEALMWKTANVHGKRN